MDSLSAAIESSFGGRPEAAARPAPSTLHCVAHPAAYLPGAFHLPGIGVPHRRNGRSTCSGISVPLAPESVFHLVRCTHLVQASAARALQNLGPLVLGNYSLHLHQQQVLGFLADGPLQEVHLDTSLAQLLQDNLLVDV